MLDAFERNFRERGEIGASVSVWWDGAELLSLGDGWCERDQLRPWTERTLAPVYSATKPLAAATLLVVLEENGLGPETPVRRIWPEFPVAASFAELLSHQCGLAALDRRADVYSHAEVVAAIEAQTPAWLPGEGHGYHPRTFGALLDEPVRRLTGRTLGEIWREKIADPLDLDFWIGLPESEWPRVCQLVPGKPGKSPGEDDFFKEMAKAGTLTKRAFASPAGLHSVSEMNEPKAWSAGLPAFGGVGTASALAKFYQAAIGAISSPLSASVRHALATPRISGRDRVLLRPTTFTCGAQTDPVGAAGEKSRRIFGPSLTAFGHPGAGGNHAFGDPETGISFAYIMNQMELAVMPGRRCLDMVNGLFAES